jgi:hypothetical protein
MGVVIIDHTVADRACHEAARNGIGAPLCNGVLLQQH